MGETINFEYSNIRGDVILFDGEVISEEYSESVRRSCLGIIPITAYSVKIKDENVVDNIPLFWNYDFGLCPSHISKLILSYPHK